jgi:Tfp pilus assembly protein PilO
MKNFLPLILIIASIGLGYLYLKPKYFEFVELRLERSGYDEVLDKSVELRQIREELSEKLSSFSQSDLDRLERMMPAEVDVVQLVLDMNNMAVKHGIIMRDIEANELSDSPTRRGVPASPPTPYKVLTLSFTFESLYNNLSPFLKELEESLRIIDIVSVNIAPNKTQPILQDYKLTIHTYWLKN